MQNKPAITSILEIAVFNLHAALLATEAGADRLELCENPAEGGTTPSYGTLKTVREKISIPVFPIIRPRGGDFLYSEEEFEVMKKDIGLCKQLQFEGVVIGMLHANGTVDAERINTLVEIAYPMEVTFHRAFDRTADPLAAMETIIACGCQRILTSGQVPDAENGKELIKQLIEKADDRVIILPGSGIRSSNIKKIAEFTGAVEMHSSARKVMVSGMSHPKQSMNEELKTVSVDVEEIRNMKALMIG
jgi:copper homeostasis protein